MTYLAPDEPDYGETFVNGKTPENARALLAACDAIGESQLNVRTAPHGFVVPDAVYDQMMLTYSTTDPDGI